MKSNKLNVIIIVCVLVILISLLFIIFNKNDDKIYTIKLENIQSSYTLMTDENGILQEPDIPTKEGYVFKGWYLADVKLEFPTSFESDTTITAKWEKKEIINNEQETPTEPPVEVPDVNDDAEEEVKENDVEVKVTNVTLSCSKLNLSVGDKKKITATISPSNYANKIVSWKSSNTSVAIVDQEGNVIAKKTGTSKITATIDGISKTCVVTVKKSITYSVEWKKVEGTSIDQYKIYIKSSEGKYVSGVVKISTTSGKNFEEKITKSGSENIYIKSAISNVKIKKVS